MSPGKALLKLAAAVSTGGPDGAGARLRPLLSADCESRFYAPFGAAAGAEAAAGRFWDPLRAAFPDFAIRPGLVLEGEYEGRRHASLLGLLTGNFMRPFCAIPPTRKLGALRIGLNIVLGNGRITHCFVMFDLVDLMRASGVYPFREMPGSPMQWPFAPADPGDEPAFGGAETLRIVREMQHGLPDGPAVTDRASAAAHHSPHWAKAMNWFGPAGIGSSRGMEGFRDSHGALFLRAFPDRAGLPRAPGEAVGRPGHFCEIGEGGLAMTGGWPVMRGRHTGGHWLGLPPTGAEVTMRVADWYRLDREGRIADNWVMIDIPHMLAQMGLDVFEDLPFAADPTLPRLP